MNFDHLPAQPRINAEVDAYSDECFRRSLEAIAVTRNERDIAYGTQERQSLDLFLPADRNARDLPVFTAAAGASATRNGAASWHRPSFRCRQSSSR